MIQVDLHNQGPVLYPRQLLQVVADSVGQRMPASDILRQVNNLTWAWEASGKFTEYRHAWEASQVNVVCASIGCFSDSLHRLAAIKEDYAALSVAAMRGEYIQVVRDYRACIDSIRSRRRGVILQVENPDFMTSPRDIRSLVDSHVHIVGLAYDYGSPLAGGCRARTTDGLSQLGKAVIREANSAHVAIDLSHCSEWAGFEAIDSALFPICTHSFLSELNPHPRAKSLRFFRALAQRGGVVGVLIHPELIAPPGKATDSLSLFANHVCRLCETVGSSHVAVGTDWAGNMPIEVRRILRGTTTQGSVEWEQNIPNYQGIGDWPNIVTALRHAGVSDADVKNVCSGAFLRWYRTLWE